MPNQFTGHESVFADIDAKTNNLIALIHTDITALGKRTDGFSYNREFSDYCGSAEYKSDLVHVKSQIYNTLWNSATAGRNRRIGDVQHLVRMSHADERMCIELCLTSENFGNGTFFGTDEEVVLASKTF